MTNLETQLIEIIKFMHQQAVMQAERRNEMVRCKHSGSSRFIGAIHDWPALAPDGERPVRDVVRCNECHAAVQFGNDGIWFVREDTI